MAGDKVNTYAQDDSDILALQLTTDKTFKGYHQLSLTEYGTTTVPAIAAGSAIECNGALYKFDTEEAISTTDPVTSSTVADGTVYVCIVPDTTTATAAFTATAPTWSDSKQGWYGTGGQANYRYAGECIKATSSYTYKHLIIYPPMYDKMVSNVFYNFYDTEFTYTCNSNYKKHANLSLNVTGKAGDVFLVYHKLDTYCANDAPALFVAINPGASNSIISSFYDEARDTVGYSVDSSYCLFDTQTTYTTRIATGMILFISDGVETVDIYYNSTYGGANPVHYIKNTSLKAIKIS